MMRRGLALPLALLAVAAFGGEHPYRTAKVGDWAEFATFDYREGEPPKRISSSRTIVVAREGDAIETATKMYYVPGGRVQGPDEVSRSAVDANKEIVAGGLLVARLPGTKAEGGGEAVVETPAGRFPCRWAKFSRENPAIFVRSSFTAWVSPDAPLSGLVKRESVTASTHPDTPGEDRTVVLLVAAGRGRAVDDLDAFFAEPLRKAPE